MENSMLDIFAYDICLISFHSYTNLIINSLKVETLLISKPYIQAPPLNNFLGKMLLH